MSEQEMPFNFDPSAPFGWPPLPMPPQPQAELRHPQAGLGDPVAAPVAEMLGPLGPFIPGAGRAAGPAGGILSR